MQHFSTATVTKFITPERSSTNMKFVPEQKKAKKLLKNGSERICLKGNFDFWTNINVYLVFHRSPWWGLIFSEKPSRIACFGKHITEE